MWRTCEKVTASKKWMKISHDVRNTGKHGLFHVVVLHLSFENTKLTNNSTNELHVNRSSSELVHRHILYS